MVGAYGPAVVWGAYPYTNPPYNADNGLTVSVITLISQFIILFISRIFQNVNVVIVNDHMGTLWF